VNVSICTVQLLLLPPTDIYPILYGEEHPERITAWAG